MLYCTMTIFTDIMVKSVIEHMRMRDNHVDDVSPHTYIDTYIHTYIHRYSHFRYTLLLYSGLTQARPELCGSRTNSNHDMP